MEAVSNPSIIFIGKLSPKINRRDTENTEKTRKTSWFMLRNRATETVGNNDRYS